MVVHSPHCTLLVIRLTILDVSNGDEVGDEVHVGDGLGIPRNRQEFFGLMNDPILNEFGWPMGYDSLASMWNDESLGT